MSVRKDDQKNGGGLEIHEEVQGLKGSELNGLGRNRVFSARCTYSSKFFSGNLTKQEVARGTEQEREKNSYIYEVPNMGVSGNGHQPLGSFVTTMTVSGANDKSPMNPSSSRHSREESLHRSMQMCKGDSSTPNSISVLESKAQSAKICDLMRSGGRVI